jgi:rRNA maturation endonuclease Nob1
MPWSVDDVEKFKKGLSDKGKKQWTRIANSVLKREMKKGKDEKEAAASAIKQANGVVQVNKEYSVYKNKQTLDYEPKIVIHQEKAHLVVPVVMMVEGVHNGSLGPIYHPIEELAKYPETWNGIPVVIYHPEKDGEPVSANSPEVIDAVTVGRVYNTSVDGKKLKAEVWFDEDKLNKVSENTLNEVNESKEIEVSLGMFADYDVEEGEWNGEKYSAIARNHRPDHLAILPDQVGACSCADGCGLGANKKIDDMAKLVDVEKTIRQLNSEGYAVHNIIVNMTGGYQEQMEKVRKLLEGLNTDKIYNYLEEMNDMFFVYSSNGHKENRLYRQEYRFDSGEIVLIDDPVEVHRKVEYIVNSSLTRNINNNQKGGQKMANAKDCPKCLEKINALITNKESKFEEADREWLLTQEESVLDKLAPVVKEVEKLIEKTVEVNKLSPADQADLAWAREQRAERRATRIQSIQANAKDQWTVEILNNMTDDMLERLFNSVKKEEAPVSYLANSFNANAGGEEPLYPAGVVINKK